MLSFCPHELDWVMFSATAALVYCGWRAAGEADGKPGGAMIEVFGADWAGTNDFDGVAAGKNRSKARWELEKGIWQNRLVPWLAERRIEVKRTSSS